ncbi:DUF3560 domain-containing protein [Citrobacter portucalensis]|uniref:DUF3560 domain-containing protein n=1 Tax=Citrobacter portucalensis TaxID=1639133 RepID=A0AAW5W958_9ENTR|nr:DUF3560 domain-containing protein [Citrobacter portucalensis]MCX9004570.1 DUF3560 domain-containing protein [Citrobacter portucalensis]
MTEVTTISNWMEHPKSLLSTDTGYKLRHVDGIMVKSAEHETLFFVQDDGSLVEDGYSYEAQTGRIPLELVEVTEKIHKLWEEQQQRGADFTNRYEERLEERRERYEDRADRARKESSALHQRASDMLSVIPLGQPILVGHHSERGHRRLLEKADNLYRKAFVECAGKADHYENKAAGVGRGGISSDDPDAVFKLLCKLQSCMKSQLRMKAANKAIRSHKKDRNQQVSALIDLGFTFEDTNELLDGDFCGRIGFASYALQNNNAEIKRLQTRIKQLESVKAVAEPQRKEYDGFDLEIDPEDNRILFYFDGKPADEVRSVLKSHSFKWSPTRKAWVRKITPNAVAQAERVKRALLDMSL